MRKLKISVPKQYPDSTTGEMKTKWITVGTMVIQDDGKVFGEIEAIPVGLTEFKFNGFEPRGQQAQQQTYQQQQYGGQK